MPIEFRHMTGTIPWPVEQNIEDLRTAYHQLEAQHQDLMAQVASLPPILSIEEIRQALGPLGSSPLPTAELLNTVPAPSSPEGPPSTPVDDGIPSHIAEVNAVYAASPVGPTSTDAEMFDFCRQVAVAILAANILPSGNAAVSMAGIGVDSTTTFSGLVGAVYLASAGVTSVLAPAVGFYDGQPGLGYHVISWNEKGNTSATFLGDDGGDGSQSGLTATVEM